MFHLAAVNGERRSTARGPSIAMWAGLTTLFGNLAAINVVALLGQEDSSVATTIAALFTAMASAAAVYTRERWHQDKRAGEPSRAEPAYPPLYDPRRAEPSEQAEASRAWLRAEAERAERAEQRAREQASRAEPPPRAEPSEPGEQSSPEGPPPPAPPAV